MLQQTTVEAVKSYFTKFVERWPDVMAMAAASEDDILRAGRTWLLFARAQSQKCADLVAAQYAGSFPTTAAELKSYRALAIIRLRRSQQLRLVSQQP